MKILKYTVGASIILVVGFLLFGVIKPELTYDCEITIDRSVAESWAVIQDEEKLAEWLPGFQRIEHVSGTPGSVGAVSMVYFDSDGQAMAIRETITDIVPNESISMLYESDFMNMDYSMTMASVDGKTAVNSSTKAVGNGIFSRSIMALIGGTIEEQEKTNLANLKKAIEENSKDYFPVEEAVVDSTSNEL